MENLGKNIDAKKEVFCPRTPFLSTSVKGSMGAMVHVRSERSPLVTDSL